ncbi:unnamed protein product [Medioppia subpectinata]|uniref:Uncharacterized protein n=1 Tax=Medioppia subpectinata TaxID=1979941 RepID=A0A7R9KT98_9ACAR|nr:unnamed protein product [Medioppia subpectinata]CAG2109417.1 unnamed protein product [Medioppia subpectinata]
MLDTSMASQLNRYHPLNQSHGPINTFIKITKMVKYCRKKNRLEMFRSNRTNHLYQSTYNDNNGTIDERIGNKTNIRKIKGNEELYHIVAQQPKFIN